MSDDNSKYFYKYRAIEKTEDLENDYTIDALFKNYAIFSSRKNFNDLFDSKIELIRPSPHEFKLLKTGVKKSGKLLINQYINGGHFTPKGHEFIDDFHEQFNNLIDSIPIFSVSKNAKSNLMWSHYANSHTGFCIEFKAEFIKAEEILYQDCIPKLNIIDLVRSHLGLIDPMKLKIKIWELLKIKLLEWKYEEEYRFHGVNAMGEVGSCEKIIKEHYEPVSVESIIFGVRMPEETKKFIIGRMPHHVKFKQAIPKTSTIDIVDSKLCTRL